MLTDQQKYDHWKAIAFYQVICNKIKCFIAGGAARNLLKGEAPKDYDFWIADDLQVKHILDAVQDTYKDLGGQFTVVVPEVYGEEYPGAGGQLCERKDIEFVVKVQVDDVDLDLIKMKRPEGESMQATEILDTFDFPFNKFILLPDSQIVGTGHMGSTQHAMRSLSEGRLAALQSRFPDHEFIDLN